MIYIGGFTSIAITLLLTLLLMVIFSIIIVGFNSVDLLDLIVILPALSFFIYLEYKERKRN
ncbi:hypothetical protein WIW90_06310 [Sulfolobaceae archaeon RB850M]